MQYEIYGTMLLHSRTVGYVINSGLKLPGNAGKLRFQSNLTFSTINMLKYDTYQMLLVKQWKVKYWSSDEQTSLPTTESVILRRTWESPCNQESPSKAPSLNGLSWLLAVLVSCYWSFQVLLIFEPGDEAHWASFLRPWFPLFNCSLGRRGTSWIN